jgi:cytoskeletal protein CcmA (bactofilin family)
VPFKSQPQFADVWHQEPALRRHLAGKSRRDTRRHEETTAMADHGSIREHWNRIHIAGSPAGAFRGTSDNSDRASDGAAIDASAGAASRSSSSPHSDGTLDRAADETVDGTSIGTFIGSGAVFEGVLTLKGDFRIDTEFRGELETDGTVTVGLDGAVVGTIRAREVVIAGAVMGNISAVRQLIVESTGKLHGDIETACLEIQKHAFFKGNTVMTQPQAYRRPVASEISDIPDAPSVHVPL